MNEPQHIQPPGAAENATGDSAQQAEALESVIIAAHAADDIKGDDIVALHVRELTTIADYFLLVTAGSTTQVQAIYEAIDEAMSKAGREPLQVEGRQEGHWILMDYADVIVHIFLADQREFYGLEKFWGDADRVDLKLGPAG